MIIGSYVKQPADKLDYDIDYADFLGNNDTLSTAVTTVEPSGLTLVSTSVVGARVKVWVSGGTHGSSYKVTVTATTGDGRIKQDEFKIRVKDY